ALRLAVFGAASSLSPSAVMTPDSYGYDLLARTLLREGRFAGGPGAVAQTRRTPGFPLLLAGVYALAGEDGRRRAVLVGIAISTFTVGLTARLAEKLWGPRAGLVAGLLLASDIASVTAARYLLTEALFTALVVAAVAAAASLVRGERPSGPRAALLGTLLACAALTRPIGLFVAVPVGLWLVHSARALGWRRAQTAAITAAVALPWIVLVGGWQLRNRAEVGAYVASDGPAKFLYMTRGADILAQRDGISYEAARVRLGHSIEEREAQKGVPRERLYLREGLALAAHHPFLFLATQVTELPSLLLGTGAAGLSLALGTDDACDLERRGARWLLAGSAALHLLLVYAGAAAGLRRAGSEPTAARLTVLLMVILTGYFVILSTGPQAYSRFRVPFMPLLAMAAGRGLTMRAERAGPEDPPAVVATAGA
ncbi:MAG TPA: glycosyltransferase family 39 protein, partial [Vicinamibacteria bacterium]|nr:glycosyltransferase family 39 protein [Vicinamibacteria bacterium]